MADTTYFAVPLPTVGGDSDAWGGLNNTLHSAWDRLLHAGALNRLSGLTLSTAGSSATFSVAAGAAADSANGDVMELASALSKTTGSWTVGDSNGALDTGSIANSTWYHVYLIKRPDTGVVDVLVSTSASSPTLPSSYTVARRIGSIKTDGSGHWVKFIQHGDVFEWFAPVRDVNAATSSATPALTTLSVPPGVAVRVIADLEITSGTVSTEFVSIYAPDVTGPTIHQVYNSGGVGKLAAGQVNARTNTSAQVYLVSSSSSNTINLETSGWVDRRGQDG